jgi:hypothetical protein
MFANHANLYLVIFHYMRGTGQGIWTGFWAAGHWFSKRMYRQFCRIFSRKTTKMLTVITPIEGLSNHFKAL